MKTARMALPRRFAWAGAALLALTAGIGWMHTPQGIAVLRAAGLPCPATGATAADVMTIREQGLERIRTDAAAPDRAALGFALETTTRAQAVAWATAHRLPCEPVDKGLRFLRCRGVDAQALGVAGPPVSELWLAFRPDGRLISVDVYRRGLDDAGAQAAWNDAARRLRLELGAPSRATGDPRPAVLRASALQTARVEYRYRDYAATLTAANLPYGGLAVREQYLSAMR
jgi:hypothetical protein